MIATVTKVDLASLAATFLDVIAWAPDLRTSLERDFLRVRNIVDTRGDRFLYIDLPKACKIVDQALSSGRLYSSDLPVSFGKLEGSFRPFLASLFRKVFDDTGSLLVSSDLPTAIFFLRQALCLYKKVEIDCTPQDVQSAIDEFVVIDRTMRVPTLTWDADELSSSNHRLSLTDEYRDVPDLISHREMCPKKLLVVLQAVSDRLASSFPRIELEHLRPGHGPGSVSDARRGTDKYLFPFWPRKLEGFFPFTLFGQHSEDEHISDGNISIDASIPINHEWPSRLIAVPKTLDKPRLIAAEPVAHQYCQKALMRWFRDNLPISIRGSINFHSQEPSQTLCLRASRFGNLATVDLSSASDRLSLWVVERVFRSHPEILTALHACRSRYCMITDATTQKIHYLLLRKFATQGSSMTFPVQSFIFLLCSLASVLFEDGSRLNSKNIRKALGQIRVFGDDIIMPSRAVSSLVLLLNHLGLKVNVGKTHVMGKFRESCGIDAYDGVDVTPVYLSALELSKGPEALVSWIDVSNNAYRKGLWHLSRWMLDQVPSRNLKYIPITNKDVSCLKLLTFQDALITLPTKWNKKFHRWEFPALQVSARTVYGKRMTSRNLLQFFVEDPRPAGVIQSSQQVPSTLNRELGFLRKVATRIRVVRVPTW